MPTPARVGEIRLHYRDEHLLVLEKPPGLLTVPGRLPENHHSVATCVQEAFPGARIVHRLDQVTSGLLLMALDAGAQRAMSMQFEHRQVGKRYVADVEGRVAGEAGEIALPLRCDWPNRPRQIVDAEAGKPSLTRWQVVGRDGAARTRLQLEPVTGRSHQLRVHLASIGHPIVGDAFYGAAGADRVHLHATWLRFEHPVRHEWMVFESAAPF